MGLSNVSNRWLNRAYKCIAIFLVIFAVLISALRLFLPYAHNYRTDLQHYINQTYGSDVIIGSLDMGWQSSGPTLVAHNVSLLQTEVAEVYIQSFDMSIDFWQSLRFRQLITKDFSLDGVKVLFDKTVLENSAKSSEDTSLLNNVAELFLSQIGHFSVNNSQVVYRSKKGQKTFLIDSLNWLNQGDLHQARGSVILDGVTSNNLTLSIDVKGDKISEMDGLVYVAANSVNIAPWLDSVFDIKAENSNSTINFDGWLSIHDGQSTQLQLQLGQNQISWNDQQSPQVFEIDGGQVVINNLDQPTQLSLFTSEINLRSNELSWQPFTFSLQRKNDSTQGYLSAADVAGINDLLPLFIKKEKLIARLKELSPVGQLSDIYFDYSTDSLSTVAKFSGVTSNYSDGIPGIENVDGQIIYHDSQLQIDALANNGQLNFDKHFNNPINYQTLSSVIDISLDDAGWQLEASNVKFSSEQLKLDADVAVTSKPDTPIQMSLLATATKGNVVDADTFYPQLLMGEDLISYLNGALKKGRIEQAVVLINGPMTNFPFEDGSGVFVVDAELHDSTFQFDQHWPAISHFAANLNFTNNSMMITGRDGTLSGIDVTGVTAAIDDLSHEQLLKVKAKFEQAKPELVTNLMLTSPLDSSVGAVLEQLAITNGISGDLDLSIPLENPEKAQSLGAIYLNNNTLNLQSPHMTFNNVTGKLSFNNEIITVNGLHALWRDMPISFDINTHDDDTFYQTDILLSASWLDKQWHKQLPHLLVPYANGTLDWTGHLTLKNFHDGQFSYQLVANSDLPNVQLNLPAPFNKNIAESVPATVRVSGDEDQSVIDAIVGEQLNFYGNLNNKFASFSQAHLILGNEQMYLPLNGFHITTNLAQANFEQWQPFIADILASLPKDKTNSDEKSVSLLSQPERIRGRIEQFDFLDESIHGVSFNLEDQIGWWLLDLSSKEARANIKFYPDWLSQGIDVDADFIHLNPNKLLFDVTESESESESETKSVSSDDEKQSDDLQQIPFDITINDEFFAQVPAMRVSCDACSYGNLNLGKMSFHLERELPNKLVLDNFVAKRKNNKLSLNGSWQHDSEHSITKVAGSFNSKDIEREIERLGLSSTVKDSALQSSFDLQWIGAPQNFSIAHLNGDVKGKLDDGYLAEVPDKARALSILSLQSLVRKLKFDFRDIFSDGMFYSEIKGDFHIQDGVVYTKNTFLKGAAGDLTVKGNTDLNTEILDYKMSYTPNYSSSLPALAWIATLNPVTFLAGIAIDEVITANVYKEIIFKVSGTLTNVDFQRIDGRKQHISVGQDTPPQIVENTTTDEVVTPATNKINDETGLIEPKTRDNQDKSDG